MLAAIAVAGQVQSTVTDMLQSLKAGFGQLKSTILETVAAFQPYKVELFGRAVKDLQAVFGQMLVPALTAATGWVRQIADYFYNLPPAFKAVVGAAAKVGLVVGAVASVAVALGGIAAAAAPFVSITGVVIAGLAAITYQMTQTASGGKLLQELLSGAQQVFSSIAAAAKAAWAQLAPIRQAFAAEASALADSLRELWASLKPVLVVYAGAAIKLALQGIVQALTWFTRQLRGFTDWVKRQVQSLGINLKLPETKSGSNKSSFGLGQQGGSITSDVAGLKLDLERQILANTGKVDEKDPNEETADNTREMKDILNAINDKVGEIAGKVDRKIQEAKGTAQGFGQGLIAGPLALANAFGLRP